MSDHQDVPRTGMGVIGAILAAVILVVSSVAAAAPAGAKPQDRAGKARSAVDRLVGHPAVMANPDVVVPKRAGEAVRVGERGTGNIISITPRLGGDAQASSQDGTTILSDAASGNEVAVQPASSGVSLFSVISDESSPSSTSYEIGLQEGESLAVDALGGVMVLRNGLGVGRFNAPWAVDSAGRSMPTSYEVSYNVITQTVDTSGAQYPVVADPHYTWGIITGTVYFNKGETKSIAYRIGIAAVVADICAFFAVWACGSAAFLADLWAPVAANAVYSGTCFKAKVPTFEPGTYSGSAGDGYCR